MTCLCPQKLAIGCPCPRSIVYSAMACRRGPYLTRGHLLSAGPGEGARRGAGGRPGLFRKGPGWTGTWEVPARHRGPQAHPSLRPPQAPGRGCYNRICNLSRPRNGQSSLSSAVCGFLSKRLRMDNAGLLDKVGRGAEK